MVVSKVAVIAIVAIISVPILLGYAMNLNEVTVSDYDTTGESVNVSQLLQTGTRYNYVNADLNSINTNFKQIYGGAGVVQPQYIKTSTSTSFPMNQIILNPGVIDTSRINCSRDDYYFCQFNYPGSGGYVNLTIYNSSDQAVYTVNHVHTYSWDRSTMNMSVTYYANNDYKLLDSVSYTIPSLNYKFQTVKEAGYTGTGYLQYLEHGSTTSTYADFSKGYYINGLYETVDASILNNNAVYLNLPQYTRNTVMTVDLNSIVGSNYTFIISIGDLNHHNYVGLIKIIRDGVVDWGLYDVYVDSGNLIFDRMIDLYYDPIRTSNSYQIIINTTGYELRYVGNWPSVMGLANYYQTYSYDWHYTYEYDSLNHVSISSNSPKMRIDSAEYMAFESPVIEDVSYSPSLFKINPATKISNIYLYGSSLTFAGNTYNVSQGNITMGSHKIPIEGMVFDSIPIEGGDYENRINGTVISTTSEPSSITFNGQWSASITTEEQELITYTKTEWVAGSFAWDGMDQNFLMVGLLTSIGAFIALGIYARMSRSSIWPLLIVCGGAALLFFVML